jgi:hypothetical protein
VKYFDYENAAREANISPDKLGQLCRRVQQEFPHDQMMYELHLLRACMAIKNGILTIDQALSPSSTES